MDQIASNQFEHNLHLLCLHFGYWKWIQLLIMQILLYRHAEMWRFYLKVYSI